MKTGLIDHDRISQAIRDAEAKTSGEIYCVLARSSSSYFFPSAFAIAVAMLLISAVLVWVLDWRWYTVDAFHLVISQMFAFAAALLVLWWMPWLRIHLVPKRVRYERAHENAVKQFLARNIHLTEARTGVLIFVSLAERYAEVVADSGINAKVEQARWNTIVAGLTAAAGEQQLTEGFVGAVDSVGELLSAHFPWQAGDKNELDDHLVEI